VVIGFGNSIRQDDGVGLVVIERLFGRVTDERVQLLERSTLTPELAETIAGARNVIFVDASAELAPAQVECRVVDGTGDADVSLVHFLSPDALLVWTQRLYQRAPEAEIWLVGVKETGLSEELTPEVAGRVDEVVTAIEARIRDLLLDS
jgi:hydrogenase maturation protease